MSRQEPEPRERATGSRSAWRVNALSLFFVLFSLSTAALAIGFLYALIFVVPEVLELGWTLVEEMRHLAEVLAEVET